MRRGVLPTLLLGVSLLVLFVARRIVAEGGVQDALLWASMAGLVAAVLWRGAFAGQAAGDARRVEARLLAAKAGVLLALGLYALSTDWGVALLGLADEPDTRLPTVLAVLWPAVLLVSGAALLFIELVYRRMPVAEAVELRRVRTAAQGGAGLALAVVFLFSLNYVTNERDHKTDLSYFKTTKPSAGTLQMVRGLGMPVTVYLFYPQVNEVLEQLRPYFDQVGAASGNLTVEVRDHALAPALAQQHRVRSNGHVLLVKGEGEAQQAEQFEVGVELDAARSRLKRLDGSFQQSFMRLTRQRREIYLTSGHDELTDPGNESGDPTEQTREFTAALRRSNINTRKVGMAQGLAHEVPSDAPAVAVVGPSKPFMPEEVDSLLRYVRGGGRLAVMVDPDVDHGLDPLLRAVGLRFAEGVVTSERQHFRRTQTPADRANVFTNRYTAHPTVTMASRHSSRVATVFVRGGAVERHEGADVLKGVHVVFPIKSGTDVWLDKDGNFERDADTEPTGQVHMMAAVAVPNPGGEEGRVVVVPDGNFVSDALIRNPGNGLVFGDIMQWLIGEEQIVGDVASEEDVRIEHTRDEDKMWFYATSFGAPLPLLGFGVWTALRRRRQTRVRQGEPGKARAAKPAVPETAATNDAPEPKAAEAAPSEGAAAEGAEPPAASAADGGEEDKP
jgi:hypothetical protein